MACFRDDHCAYAAYRIIVATEPVICATFLYICPSPLRKHAYSNILKIFTPKK